MPSSAGPQCAQISNYGESYLRDSGPEGTTYLSFSKVFIICQAIFKTSDKEVNLLHVFSDGVSRDAKKIEEGGQGKGHADEASFPSGDEGEQTKRHRS